MPRHDPRSTGAPPADARSCPHCGSTDLVLGLKLNQTADAGHVGLPYKTARIFVATEPLRADLCRRCGTVARWFVEEPDRPWAR